MILSIFRFLASHPPFLFAAIVIHVLSVRECMKEAEVCETKANETLPDSRLFGYSSEQLHELYKVWGTEGRQAYVKTANTDLFPFMQSYALIMGSLLVLAAKRLRWKDEIAYLAVLTMLFDACETLVQRRGSQVYPVHLSDAAVTAGSLCCQLKWLLFGVSTLLVVSSFAFGSTTPRKSKTRRYSSTNRRTTADELPPGLLLAME